MKRLMIIIITFIFTVTLAGCNTPKKNEQAQKSKEKNIVQQEPKEEKREIFSLDGLDTASIGWGIKKNENAPPEVPGYIQDMISKYNGYYIGDTNSKKLYLTFDEGYENGYTPQILDILKENNVKAAFFVTGAYVDREEKLVKRMVREGHIVGNHSVNHPSLPSISDDEMEKELTQLDEKVKQITGQKMIYVRPPRGEYSERVLAHLSNMGYITVFWSFAYLDWDITMQRGGEYAYNQIMPYINGGAILLLHAVSSDNAQALDRVIKEAKSAGYKFCTLDEL
ncbi:MAG: delta-lactam-biosynthetic de-N-acetylase [Bacillota bacterium]|nr:delta-lactam-biosynthetic de-N-acetylase [Bacillota bacterium]